MKKLIRLSIKPKLVEKVVLRTGFIPARLSFQDNRENLSPLRLKLPRWVDESGARSTQAIKDKAHEN